MKDILKNILSGLKLSKKNIMMLSLAVAMLVLLIISEFSGNKTKENFSEDSATDYAEDYIKDTEKRLENVLGDVSGAGKVKVMITLESCYENVYAKGYTSKAKEGEKEESSELTEEYVIVKQGSNNEECLVIKVYEPRVKGVAVIAQGADNINVKQAITDTVCALFDISSASVSVEKMIENK